MKRMLSVIGLGAALCVGSVGYTIAQDAPATPEGNISELCATPLATPEQPGTPEINTTGSPEAIATSVAENVDTGIQSTACGTPEATPVS
ncbi:MAG TPA: hypothetical protein VGT61_12525 [Thermomicrobiales bacterium]|jgi:hypothetical protein|nr:hypothetical protein [Thermomicrobiales bacterium]